jgi:hypothetical protein
MRDDELERLPDELVGCISELPFRLTIQQDDLPAPMHHEHRVWRGVQQL